MTTSPSMAESAWGFHCRLDTIFGYFWCIPKCEPSQKATEFLWILMFWLKSQHSQSRCANPTRFVVALTIDFGSSISSHVATLPIANLCVFHQGTIGPMMFQVATRSWVQKDKVCLDNASSRDSSPYLRPWRPSWPLSQDVWIATPIKTHTRWGPSELFTLSWWT